MPVSGEQSRFLSRLLLVILAVSFLLNVTGIGWGLPSMHGWALDEITPVKVLAGMEQGFSHGWHGEYPPLHFYILSVFYLPFILLQHLHLIDIKSNFTIYTLLFYLGRLFSVLLATVIVYLVYRIGCELFDRRAALFSALITALMGPFVYYAKMTNVDIPYIFWFVLSLLFFVRILKTHRQADYLLFALTAIAAICTKDQAFGLYVLTPIPIVLSGYFYQKTQNPEITFRRVLFDRKIWIASGAAVLLFALIHNVVFNLSGFIGHVRLIIGPSSEGYRMYPGTVSGQGRMFWQALKHLQFLFGWPLAVVCLLGLATALLQKKRNRLLLSLFVPAISYYIFFIGAVMYHYDRFLIPIAILLSFFGGKGLADWLVVERGFRQGRKIIVSLFVGYSLWYAASVNINMIVDSRYKIEAWMAKHIQADATIGFIGVVQCLPRSAKFKNSKFLFFPDAERIRAVHPDFLVFNPAINFGRADFYESLMLENLGYVQVLSYRTPVRWTAFGPSAFLKNNTDLVHSNLDKINPEIKIYRLSATRKGLRQQPQ